MHLVDALAASCAVPAYGRMVTIEAHDYMDGGVCSSANAGPVVVVSPADADLSGLSGQTLSDELRAPKPARVAVITAEADSTVAFGTNPLAE